MKRSICSRCHRPSSVCYCHTLRCVDNVWPIHILQHPTESKHAIGTARIAQLSLSRCELTVGEQFDEESLRLLLSTDQQPLLVYPGEGSQPLESLDREQPQPLIFLDASWRRSRRMLLESPALMALPKISFQLDEVPRYRIRKAPDRHSVSTLEAVVAALSVLEKDTEKFQNLFITMDWMIEKQIESMGQEVFEKNYQGYF